MSNSIDRYRQLCAQGLNALQIAERLQVNKNTVYQNCKRHGIALSSVIAGKPNSRWRAAS
jgi:transposase